MDSNSQGGNSLGSVKFHPLTLSYTPGSMQCDSQASLLACNLASPYLGHEPKARVAIRKVIHKSNNYVYYIKKNGLIVTIIYIKLPTSNSLYGMFFISTIYSKVFGVVNFCNLHQLPKV
jgi:hypothetical protein